MAILVLLIAFLAFEILLSCAGSPSKNLGKTYVHKSIFFQVIPVGGAGSYEDFPGFDYDFYEKRVFWFDKHIGMIRIITYDTAGLEINVEEKENMQKWSIKITGQDHVLLDTLAILNKEFYYRIDY